MCVKYFITSLICFFSIFSNSQQLNRMVLENWVNGEWQNRMQEIPSYNVKGRLVKTEIAYWDADLNSWENQTKTEYSRDENGSLLRRDNFKWLEDGLTWEATLRVNFSINDNNKPNSVLTEVKHAENWINQSIDDYTYDSKGKLIEKRSERWDKRLNSWVPDRKYIYSIESERTAGYTIFFWDNKFGEWQPYKKASYVYLGNDTIDHIFFESWIDGMWQDHSIRRNLRDDEGVLNTIEVDQFDLASEIWEKSSHVDFKLTEFGEIDHSVSKKWNSESNSWDNLQRSTYTYSNDGAMDADQKVLELFPNPTTESLTIRYLTLGKVTIHDALGKNVLQLENKNGVMHIDVSKWEIGVYSVRVNGSEIEKFVKL